MARKKTIIDGLTRSHLDALGYLDAEVYRCAREMREAGAVLTVGRCMATMAKRGLAEVELKPRPDPIKLNHERARGRESRVPTVPTKCYRITGRGQKMLAATLVKFAELEAAPEVKPGPPRTGRAPDDGRVAHPWALNGRGVTA